MTRLNPGRASLSIVVDLPKQTALGNLAEMISKWASAVGGECNPREGGFAIRLPAEVFRNLDGPSLVGLLEDVPKVGRIADISLSPELKRALGGPPTKWGDLVRMLGIRGPGLASYIRLPASATPAEVARRFYELALKGLDVGVDPPWLVKPDEIGARASHTADMRDRVKEEIGKRVNYVINVSSSSAVELADKARDSGADLIGFSPEWRGWGGLWELRGQISDLPIFVYGGESSGLAPPARCYLARLLGGSMVGVPALQGREEVRTFRLALKRLTSPDEIERSMPVLLGVIHPGMVEINLSNAAEDHLLILSDAHWLHPTGEEGGISALRQAIDAFLRGETVLEAAKVNEELRMALERWGYHIVG